METKILVFVLIITSVLTYPANARNLVMVAKGADEQKEYFGRPLPPYFGGFGGARPQFGGGFGSGFFGPFDSISGGGGFGEGTGFNGGLGSGKFGENDHGSDNPNANGDQFGDSGKGEGSDASIGHDMP